MPSLVGTLSGDQDAAWKCPFCSKGISLEAARSAGDPRIARDKRDHKRTDHPRLSWKRWQGPGLLFPGRGRYCHPVFTTC